MNSIRIIYLDSYMSKPTQGLDVVYSEFRGSATRQVPILRLFGTTGTGKKICLHIHGVFPYFYIPYDGTEEVNSLMYKIAGNIDKAVNISFNQASSNTQHVYKISLVSGIPMYGYHSRQHQFLKIYVYNPLLIRRISSLLMNDSTLGRIYQPHETHLPFTLQFMIDYNLHGMGILTLSEMKFRVDPNQTDSCVNPDLILPAEVKKISVCELECDTFADNILNRLEVASGNIGVNPGISALWADEMQRRRNKGETSQIQHLLELNNVDVVPTNSHIAFKQALIDRLNITSTDESHTNRKFDSSVYPAETPENVDIQTASMIDSRTASGLESSLNDTTFTSIDINHTLSSNLHETFDADTQNFLKLLQDLEAKANEDVDEDSILSQIVNENEEEKEVDLSMPLGAVMTPKKIIPSNDDSEETDLWNTTLIPQLDGEYEDEQEYYNQPLVDSSLLEQSTNNSSLHIHLSDYNDKKRIKPTNIKRETDQKLIKKVLYVQLVRTDVCVKGPRSMPLLDDTDIEYADSTYGNFFTSKDLRTKNVDKKTDNDEEWKPRKVTKKSVLKIRQRKCTKKVVRKISEKRTLAELKSLSYQLKRIKRKHQILRIMKKIHDKEHKICVMLSKNNGKPIFKIIPRPKRSKFIPIKDLQINIISEILLKTRNYVDPNLRMVLQYPTEERFLYVYNGNSYPEIVEIPTKFAKLSNERMVKLFYNKKYKTVTRNNPDLNNVNENKSVIRKSSLCNDCNVTNKDLEDSLEFLRNNVETFSGIVHQNHKHCDNLDTKNNILSNSQCAEFNIEQEIYTNSQSEPKHFPPKVENSEDNNSCYIFSWKYLTNIKDTNLTSVIENQPMNQIRETLKNVEKELQKHVKFLKAPVCKETKPSINIYSNIEQNEISNDRIELTQNLKNEEEEIDEKLHVNNSQRLVYVSFDKNENRPNLKIVVKNVHGYNKDKEIDLFSSKRKSDLHMQGTKCEYRDNATQKYLSLDGTQDSSSSDDDESNSLQNKRHVKSKNGSQYSTLPVTVLKSKFQRGAEYSPIKHLVSQNITKNVEEKETSITKSINQKSVCDINVKRRLSFDNTSALQSIVIEEKLVCSYSPYNKQEKIVDRLKLDKSINIQQSGFSQNTCDTNIAYVKELSGTTDDFLNMETSFHKNKSSNDSDSTNAISSSPQSECEDNINTSFFNSPQIAEELNALSNIAQKYDKEKNYHAKEGTSKVFTPLTDTHDQNSSKENLQSSESSSFGLITPYQHVSESKKYSNTTSECKGQINCSTNKSFFESVIDVTHCDIPPTKLLTSIKKAPTRDQIIKSLDTYKIPLVKQNKPFYSKIEDVTGSIIIGHSMLKVTSNTSEHLAEFESQTDSINQFRKNRIQCMPSSIGWKRSNINNLALSFCKDRNCIITPVKKPPSIAMVTNWVKEKSRKIVSPETKLQRKKIFIPLSPNNENCDDGEDMNTSLTLSPCIPISSQQSNSQTTGSQTPKSSKCGLRKSLLVAQNKSRLVNSCQITGVSPNNTYGFENSTENLQAARALIEHQYLTLLVMELHIQTRGEFKPNPEYDSVRAIFYSVSNDVPANHPKRSACKGVIAINSLHVDDGCKTPILDGIGADCDIAYVESEVDLLNEFLKLIAYWDPDILAGYEIQMLSWGYLVERASVLGMNFKALLNRTNEVRNSGEQEELHIIGRIMMDVWRLMRHEIALQSYTFESVTYHILHKRVPQYTFYDLSFWWDHRSTLYRYRTVQYYLFRVGTILELFDKLDIIGRTSELARLFGIQFFEVMSRGSQFRVESMMMRLAKPLNFIPVSPSVQQKAKMKAPEYIPLVLEPESKLYNDPVIVLDFQSLYPSIIIAYNYCFTTCLGRVESLGKNIPFEFGATQLKVSRKRLEKLLKKDLINFSPCGIGFVKKKVRDGILPRMLREILDTRLMVKNSMKENKENHILQKVLHSRQLGLKLIANVTYGYTAANFSGRMPSVEVGDSVVSKGRETLQRAIEMVDTTPEWGARVVYGDTDSLFVMVPGKTRQHAFEIGKKIADAVTKANPDPIKLKLEKVYQPCILQTKKRYVGYMYESPEQTQPVYDAKGIETVRRDGCPAVSKMLEKCLRMLFETMDISLIKKYVLQQFNKLLAGRASIQDLTFAKEYRGLAGYRPGACVPSLTLAKKWTAVDKRNEPRRGERVPYIIVNGPPGLPLIRLVRSPRDLLNDPALRPNALYYITKVIIPPINRCFNLIGVDLNTWFNQMPRKHVQVLPGSVSPEKKSTIAQYFSTTSCVGCGEQTQSCICYNCLSNPQSTSVTLMEKLRNWERRNDVLNIICQSCTSTKTEIKCVSLDCPLLYLRIQTDRDMQQASYVRQVMSSSEMF